MLKLLAALSVALLLVLGVGSATGSASSCQQSMAESTGRSSAYVACAGCEAPMEHNKAPAACAINCALTYGAILPALPLLLAPSRQQLFPEGSPRLPSLAGAPDPFPPRASVII